MRILIASLFILLTIHIKAESKNDSLKYNNLKIWNPSRVYEYDALYLDVNGDTISKEKILVKPTGQISPLQKSQTVLEYIFNYSTEDSIRLNAHPIHENDYTRKYKTIIWRKEIKEGAEESSKSFWIHPFRINQYVLTEVAPFPEITLPLKVGNKISSITFIQKGWGLFKGNCKSTTETGEPQTREYSFGTLTDCYEVRGSSVHNKLGESKIIYYFNQEYGFTEMKYHFYNGQSMEFILNRIIIK